MCEGCSEKNDIVGTPKAEAICWGPESGPKNKLVLLNTAAASMIDVAVSIT